MNTDKINQLISPLRIDTSYKNQGKLNETNQGKFPEAFNNVISKTFQGVSRIDDLEEKVLLSIDERRIENVSEYEIVNPAILLILDPDFNKEEIIKEINDTINEYTPESKDESLAENIYQELSKRINQLKNIDNIHKA